MSFINTEVLSLVDGVHFTEEVVPIQQQQVGVAVVSALEDSPDLFEPF